MVEQTVEIIELLVIVEVVLQVVEVNEKWWS